MHRLIRGFRGIPMLCDRTTSSRHSSRYLGVGDPGILCIIIKYTFEPDG